MPSPELDAMRRKVADVKARLGKYDPEALAEYVAFMVVNSLLHSEPWAYLDATQGMLDHAAMQREGDAFAACLERLRTKSWIEESSTGNIKPTESCIRSKEGIALWSATLKHLQRAHRLRRRMDAWERDHAAQARRAG